MFASLLGTAFRLAIVLTVCTGLLYPGVVTGVAQLLFPFQANGSLVEHNGRVVGSELLAQPFSEAAYLHARASAAGGGYDATASSGTNAGPTSSRLRDALTARALVAESLGVARGEIPADMITASASGLDPHVSPANARRQLVRVARARGVPVASLDTLLGRYVEPRTLGVLGEPRVNVLRFNLMLDSLLSIR
ncbi:MAG: potassium-transporting ATPase subunit KdpC [Gemmatimonadaceae bacterium]|jgi:K+-transporting ATPase ATPase C chain|nr:potassium-transporting ATPase subunit KdpC [Gemmatimonadaceae bacterium]